MTTLPTASDLYVRPDLIPLDEIADRLAEAIRGTDKFLRKSTVTVSFGVTFNVDLQRLEITTAVKSKRPVKEDRNEEVIGEEGFVFAIKKEIPGQGRLPGTEGMHVTIGKDAAAGRDD